MNGCGARVPLFHQHWSTLDDFQSQDSQFCRGVSDVSSNSDPQPRQSQAVRFSCCPVLACPALPCPALIINSKRAHTDPVLLISQPASHASLEFFHAANSRRRLYVQYFRVALFSAQLAVSEQKAARMPWENSRFKRHGLAVRSLKIQCSALSRCDN